MYYDNWVILFSTLYAAALCFASPVDPSLTVLPSKINDVSSLGQPASSSSGGASGFWGFLNDDEKIEYVEESIRSKASSIASRLSTVNLLLTVPQVTSTAGLNSVIASSFTSSGPPIQTVGATSKVQMVPVSLCVPTPNAVSLPAASSQAAPATITQGATLASIIPSAVSLAVPSSESMTHITTWTSNGIGLPVIQNLPTSKSPGSLSGVDPAITTAIGLTISSRPPSPTFTSLPVLATPLFPANSSSISHRFARRNDPAPRESSTGSNADIEDTACAYPMLNGHRLAKDSGGNVVILVDDPWANASNPLSANGFSSTLEKRGFRFVIGNICII